MSYGPCKECGVIRDFDFYKPCPVCYLLAKEDEDPPKGEEE